MSEIRRLIEAYRKLLKPGVYFSSEKMDSGTIIGIEETMGEYVSQEGRDRYGGILVYSHLGLRGDNVESLTALFRVKLLTGSGSRSTISTRASTFTRRPTMVTLSSSRISTKRVIGCGFD